MFDDGLVSIKRNSTSDGSDVGSQSDSHTGRRGLSDSSRFGTVG